MVKETKIDFKKIEKKWQDKWEKARIFHVKENKDKKYYVLEMFPYPSASGLHMGHALNYVIGDIYARFKRMQKFNVLYPMGYDALGLPAENAAIKEKKHPKHFTEKAISNFIKQQKELGLSYDWSRIIKTSDPEYYKWNQFFFLKLLENNLVYRKKASVNFCQKCDTVLANEQVHNGKCWRHEDTDVEIKHLEQWFIKITNYAEELLNEIDNLDWPEKIKIMQKNWIGKSHGTEIDFEIFSEKNNYVLLHGYKGTSEKNFFLWLKNELENRGYKVTVPILPNTDNPNINEQVKYVLKNCNFDENTVLLGHSLGSVVALKVLEKLKKPIKKLINVAGFVVPNTKNRPYIKTFNWKYDFNKIRKNVKEILILKDIDDLVIRKDAADKIKAAIGGEIISFSAKEQHVCASVEPEVLNSCLEKWPIFTTRPDTIYGVTFMVISSQHPRLFELVTEKQKTEVEGFLKKIKTTSEKEILEKEGVFTGSYAINPINKEKIPIWVGNFVLADYGSGMVMAVPAHDQRDIEFAKKYNLPVKLVVKPINEKINEKDLKEAYIDEGKLVNSEKFNGLNSKEAIKEITYYLSEKKLGKPAVNYKLKDWLISRQRYWGTPIPMIYCERCGIVPVSYEKLPVRLPEKVKFGKGNPLTTNKNFINVKCPKCKGKSRRETDTMDTFFDSSWYFLRFADPKNNKKPFEQKRVKYWLPVNQYIGGAEHACMHLIYARFFTKALRDIGFLKMNEPFIKLFNQGMLHGEDGFVMSKSRGNVVLPEQISKKYGIDTARLFLVSIASPDRDVQWSEKGIEGSFRFIKKIFDFFSKKIPKSNKQSKRAESKINQLIKKITEDIENFRYSLATIKLREFFEVFSEEPFTKKDAESFLKLLSVFCPHISEELWHKIGSRAFISIEKWPKADETKIDEKIEKQEEITKDTLADINNIIRLVREKQNKDPKSIYLYVIPKEISFYNLELLTKKLNKKIKIFAVNDKNKYDPENKSLKAKPGKPGIYVE